MPMYNIGFSEKLIEAGNAIIKDDRASADARRAVLYLSLLSSEITLKALLEKAGVDVKIIKKRSHRLHELLSDIGKCKIPVKIGNSKRWASANRIRSILVDKRYRNATVGHLLEANKIGLSKYPDEIRYGDKLFHYPPLMMLKAATKSLEWAKEHWETIRI